jgi:hypothetical protein
MYRTIRSIHLCAGLFSLVFLAMYGVSAVQMTHGGWLRMRPRVVTRIVTLPRTTADARALARELAERYGIAGELTGIHAGADGVSFRILRPGIVWQADYVPATGETALRITDSGLLGMLNRIHQMRGLWHEWGAYNLWAMLLAMVGAAILTLGATGVYLWWKTNRNHRWSGAVLAVSVAVVGGLAAWMRMG